MKTFFSKSIITLGLICGVALAAPITAYARVNEDQASTGTNGTNGANGASGNPAKDGASGGNGGLAEANAVSLTGNATARAFGGNGGKGGNGGNGIGPNVDGGQGGNGGRGGRAKAWAESSATGGKTFARAVGGRGGQGGEGGNASGSGISGFGGYGGQGGMAMARAVTLNGRSATAIAVGGRSGNSGGEPFSTSFPGGAASAFAQATNNAGPVTIIARQFGGNGGTTGGNGAASNIVNGVVGSSSTNLVFEQNARGGHGGAGLEGPGGNGGGAFSGFRSGTLTGGNYVNGTVLATAGNGGASSLAPYNAGAGGNAGVSYFNTNKNQGINLRAIAGHGGDHLAGRFAGNGGTAYLDSTTIGVQNGGNIDLRGLFIGGNGGSTLMDAKLNQARGGQALINNTLNLDSSASTSGANSIRAILNLRGGNGGSFGDVNRLDRYVGLAGSAIGRVDETADALQKHIRINAFGGQGANFVKDDPESTLDWAGGNGGRAEVDIKSTNASGSVLVEANATGGNTGTGGQNLFSPLGFLGFGGEAIARGTGTSSAVGADVNVITKAVGGLGLNSVALNGGGGAKSYATAIGNSDNQVDALAFSTATNSSDGAYSDAKADSGSGSANALASADGKPQDARIDVLGSTAEANANSRALLGNATAQANAVAGNLQTAYSTATSLGTNSIASASSVGGNSLWSLSGIRGGNANSTASADASFTGLPTTSQANAYSKAGDIDISTGITGIGGFSIATANATSQSTIGAEVTATAHSIAGKGSNYLTADGRDGRADALATANLPATMGRTQALAKAESSYFGNAVANAHGGQSALATAEVSQGGGGFARALSSTNNMSSGMAQSIARFVGPSTTIGSQRGTVLADASTVGTEISKAELKVSGVLDAFNPSLVNFGTAQAVVGHRSSVADVMGVVVEPSAAFTHYQLSPLTEVVDAFMASAPTVRNEFNNVLGIGMLGNTAGIDTAFRSKFDLTMDISMTDQDIKVGFFDNQSTGTGFDTLRLKMWLEGNMVVDQTFMDLASANTFFNGNVISLGAVASVTGPMDFEVEWLMNTNPNSSFMVKLAFGSGNSLSSMMMPVPEPSGLAMLMLGTLGLAFRRIRRRG